MAMTKTRVVVLEAVLALVAIQLAGALPPLRGGVAAPVGIQKRHELPAPYHTTDDVLLYIQGLSKGCGKPDNFKLELRSGVKGRDLEQGSVASISHGKSDDYFDYQSKRSGLSDHTMIQLEPLAEPNQGLPSSWQDKTTPPSELPVLHVTLGPASGAPKHKAFLMFGEHGRELISCEIGMAFIKTLHDVACSSDSNQKLQAQTLAQIEESEYKTAVPYSQEQVRALLEKWDLTIMPVASPSARELAERSDFCNRKNSHSVDVNRNYPFHFGEGSHPQASEQFPGTSPLTEPETRVASDIAQTIHPKLFVAVHSGAEMIVTSPAYRKFDLEQMPVGVQRVVKGVQGGDCPECTAGPASQVLSYLAYGCSMDYMFEQGFSQEAEPTKPSEEHFSFTFETWAGDREAPKLKAMDFEKEFGADATKFKEQDAAFHTLRSQVGEQQYECLTRFNPPPSLYNKIVSKWSKAIFSTMDAVGKELDAKAGAAKQAS